MPGVTSEATPRAGAVLACGPRPPPSGAVWWIARLLRWAFGDLFLRPIQSALGSEKQCRPASQQAAGSPHAKPG